MNTVLSALFPTIVEASPLSGGDINEVFRVRTEAGQAVVKLNRSRQYPGMFSKEAQGLELLSSAKGLRIPEVYQVKDDGEWQALLLEWLPTAPRMKGFEMHLAEGLANIHRTTNPYFGLDQSNYIGSLEQPNPESGSFTEFYFHHRLWHMARQAEGELGSAFLRHMEKLPPKLADIIPEESPALLHGDLWAGNLHVGPEGEPCLIDPAVYYGHREIDLAMSRLFGGFGSTFYHHYNETYPLEPDWEDRIDLWQLYPLLVHVNLFGSTYVRSASSALARYVR